jgi:hypothetical protein
MKGEVKEEYKDLSKDFKDLPPEKRLGVIMTAKHLLKIQKDSKDLLDDDCPAPPENERAE